MLSSEFVAIVVLIVVALAAAPIFYIFLWRARHHLTRASEDARAGTGRGRLRLGFLLTIYGGVAAFALVVGFSQVLSGHFVGLILVALGLPYSVVIWRVLSRNRVAGRQQARRPPL
jgi:hypothetical protein